MEKAKLVHLRNKYPEHKIVAHPSSIQVYDKDDNLIVALEKNAHGHFECQKDQYGARDRFCHAPIPKDARVHKLWKDGSVGLAEEHEERKELAKQYICPKRKCVKSLEDIENERLAALRK